MGLPAQGICEAAADPAVFPVKEDVPPLWGGPCFLLVGTEGLWIFVLCHSNQHLGSCAPWTWTHRLGASCVGHHRASQSPQPLPLLTRSCSH